MNTAPRFDDNICHWVSPLHNIDYPNSHRIDRNKYVQCWHSMVDWLPYQGVTLVTCHYRSLVTCHYRSLVTCSIDPATLSLLIRGTYWYMRVSGCWCCVSVLCVSFSSRSTNIQISITHVQISITYMKRVGLWYCKQIEIQSVDKLYKLQLQKI